MENWWDQNTDANLRYALYKIKNTEVLIGSRPNCWGCTLDFYNSVKGWISVTGKHIKYPVNANARWFPWNENNLHPSYEVLFATLRTLNYWIEELNLERIYMHCCAGTHRSPRLFGAYLYTYHKDISEEIVKNVILVKREHLSNPIEYNAVDLREFPNDKIFLEMLADYPDNEGNEFDDLMNKFNEKIS